MKQVFVGSLFVASALFAASVVTHAQGPQQGPAAGQGQAGRAAGGGQGAPAGGGGGGGRGGAPAAPPLIDLATAKAAITAAEAAANAANAKVAIAVVDANGDLVYFERMDGAPAGGPPSSQAKARAAIVFGVPTKAVADAAAAGTPLSATITPSGVNNSIILIQQGGIPLFRGGKLIGAIGAGGSTSANDEMFAKAGADVVK
jgi:glc operon protein GlcG